MQITLFSLLLATSALANPVLQTRQNGDLSGAKIRLLPLGDSITWGTADSTGNGYRGPLYNSLKSAGVASLDFVGSVKNGNMADPDNEGHPGYTINQIAASAAKVTSLNPNVILLHAGTNDAIQQSQSYTGAISNLQTLIDQLLKQWPDAILLVAQLIPEAVASRESYIQQINKAIPGIVSTRASAGKKIAVVDMSDKLVRSDYVEGTHPTTAGYAKMAALWFTGLQSVAAKGWFGNVPSPMPTTTTTPAGSAPTPKSKCRK